MKHVRKLYDWILSWAGNPYGLTALVVLALSESVFFPIPPDPLLMALTLGLPAGAWRFATWCTTGSVVGGILGYGLGHFLWWADSGLYFNAVAASTASVQTFKAPVEAFSGLANLFFTYVPGFTTALFETVRLQYQAYSFLIVFTAGFTPIPYKVITITSGAFGISFPVFMAASLISRGMRFFLVAGLLWKFGEPVKDFIDRYFNLLTLSFVLLLIAGFGAFKMFF